LAIGFLCYTSSRTIPWLAYFIIVAVDHWDAILHQRSCGPRRNLVIIGPVDGDTEEELWKITRLNEIVGNIHISWS
jgi:hypothetical protein